MLFIFRGQIKGIVIILSVFLTQNVFFKNHFPTNFEFVQLSYELLIKIFDAKVTWNSIKFEFYDYIKIKISIFY